MNCEAMEAKDFHNLMRAYHHGEIDLRELAQKAASLNYVTNDEVPRGFPAFVSGQNKTRPQTVDVVERLVDKSPNVLVTHTDAGTFGEVRNVCTEAEWHEVARIIRIWRDH